MSGHKIWFFWWMTGLQTNNQLLFMHVYVCVHVFKQCLCDMCLFVYVCGWVGAWIETLLHNLNLPDLADLVARCPVLNFAKSSLLYFSCAHFRYQKAILYKCSIYCTLWQAGRQAGIISKIYCAWTFQCLCLAPWYSDECLIQCVKCGRGRVGSKPTVCSMIWTNTGIYCMVSNLWQQGVTTWQVSRLWYGKIQELTANMDKYKKLYMVSNKSMIRENTGTDCISKCSMI